MAGFCKEHMCSFCYSTWHEL